MDCTWALLRGLDLISSNDRLKGIGQFGHLLSPEQIHSHFIKMAEEHISRLQSNGKFVGTAFLYWNYNKDSL